MEIAGSQVGSGSARGFLRRRVAFLLCCDVDDNRKAWKYQLQAENGIASRALSFLIPSTITQEVRMNGIIYIIGLIVVVLAVLSLLGLR